MFAFGSRVSTRTLTVTGDLCGCTGRAAMSLDPRFEVKELGEIDVVSMTLATQDLVTHNDAQSAFPAVHLEGHTLLSYGELAGLVGESGRVPRHDSKARVLCAGDRDLPTLLAYLAALRLGHAVAFLAASIDHELLKPPDTAPSPGCSSRPSGHTSAARMGACPTRSAGCSADQ
jgi:hypothetical protein